MNYFGFELRFGLVKNINQDFSLINLIISEVILKFLIQYQSELNINIDKFTQIQSEEVRYLYREEVEELRDFAHKALNSFGGNFNTIVQDYRNKLNLSENEFSQDDVSEVFHHLIHLCNTAIDGQKILYLSVGYDDSAFIEG